MKQVLIVFFVLSAQLVFAQTAKLTIIVDNIEEIKGRLELGIYNEAENFPKEDLQYKKIYHKVNSKTEKIIIDLPIGEYAVAVYHDVNTNGKCDRNFIRIPTEAYGFSNNIKPLLSAPDFKETKFSLNKDTTIKIDLIQ